VLGKIFNTLSIKLAAAICNLLIAVVVSRYLGATGKGEQSIVLTSISIILIFVNIAGGATLVYLAPRHKMSHLISISYIWSILIAFIFYVILHFLNIVSKDFIGHICLLSLINSYAAINSNLLLGKEKIKASNWVNLIQPVVTLLVLLSFFILKKNENVKLYIYALYIAYSLSFLFSIYKLRQKTFIVSLINVGWKDTLLAMFSIGFLNQLSHLTGLLNARLSYYLLGEYKGSEQLGIYSNGVSLTEAVWMVSGSMAMVQYASIANSTNKEYAQQLTLNLTKISILISFAIIIPMILLPSSFYSLIFGKEFVNINYIMMCLAPGVIFWNFSLLIGHYFSGTGKFYIEFTASSVGLFITLVLSFWAIPIWGYYGAGIITSLSYFFNSLIVLYFFKKESNIGIKNFFPNLIDIKNYVNSLKSIIHLQRKI